MIHRLFVALLPPREIRAELLATMSGIDGARWQTDNQLHLTLAFPGEVDRHRGEAAVDALGLIRSAAVDLRLGLPGTFDSARPGRIGTLWIGVEPVGALAVLARSVRTASRRAGLPPDSRQFLPHITLARFGSAGVSREALRPWMTHHALPPIPWRATRFHLVESRMGAGGSHYEPVASFPLTA